jgi:branched-subunit amino acid aminotransferase/4-amino-4-deoxychorismate lyase
VTRSILLEIAPQAGFSIVEQTLRLDDLYAADEVFITSTNRSCLAVGEIQGHMFALAPGPITQQLESVFARYLDEYVARASAPASQR